MNPTAYHAERALLRLPGVGVATYWKLLTEFASAADVLAASPAQLARWLPDAALSALAHHRAAPDSSDLGRWLGLETAYLREHPDVTLLSHQHPDYPLLLRQIAKPPPLLYVRGDAQLLSMPQLALVGSRSPSADGRDNGFAFAKHLAASGFAITSGLARGIDAAAHQGAMAAGGTTLAIMGTGIDQIYPTEHRALAQAIVTAGGCLVSEFPLGTGPHASHFPRRNRLISGLSLGVLVVEAALKSGSLITARYAMEDNREVFAIPGSIHNPQARGCHQLLRDGAVLVEQSGDIIEHLSGLLAFNRDQLRDLPASAPAVGESTITRAEAAAEDEPNAAPVTDIQRRLLAVLAFDAVPLEVILSRAALDVGAAMAALMELEIAGLISQTAQGYRRARHS